MNKIAKKQETKIKVLVSLSPKELEKVKPISSKDIREALEAGKRDRDAAAPFVLQSTINTRTLFSS